MMASPIVAVGEDFGFCGVGAAAARYDSIS